ncbi:MAG: ribonuclease P protein component [Roseinatronobacter sp.]
MAPPGADSDSPYRAAEKQPAELSCLPFETLKQRTDFLRAARARRIACEAFLLQARATASTEPTRVGYTCSKKVGNAVQRNRAKRRLRAVARSVVPFHGRPGWDYVLIGRPNFTVSHDFAQMCDDLRRALTKLHGNVQ